MIPIHETDVKILLWFLFVRAVPSYERLSCTTWSNQSGLSRFQIDIIVTDDRMTLFKEGMSYQVLENAMR